MHLKLRILVLVMGMVKMLPAQTPDQIANYINTYKQLAISEMQRTGVPASIILAQGIHETSAGTSDLVIASKNHFGIKCKSSWTGQVVYHDDDARGECFRSYAAAEDSYRDHSDYLLQTPRYAFLFKLDPEDFEGWAYGLRKAGYATNIRYSQILIKLIHDYDLEQYTLIALGKLPAIQPVTTEVARNSPNPDIVKTAGTVNTALPLVAYPEGTFSINATKVVFVHAGISLLSLSNQYDLPLARLLDFNDMNQQDVLSADQLIFLQRKRKAGTTSFHIVRGGETMYTICQAEGIRYEAVLELNQLRPGEEPLPGEKIYLQSVSGVKPALKVTGAKTTIPSF